MRTALFPGTFDPPSMGHLNIIERGKALCDRLIVGVSLNTRKQEALFSTEERVALLEDLVKGLPGVEVCAFNGLVVDFALENDVNFLIRGQRGSMDSDMEFQMATVNKTMSGIETVFLLADKDHRHISSSLVREIGFFGRDISDFVPHSIVDRVLERIRKKGKN